MGLKDLSKELEEDNPKSSQANVIQEEVEASKNMKPPTSMPYYRVPKGTGQNVKKSLEKGLTLDKAVEQEIQNKTYKLENVSTSWWGTLGVSFAIGAIFKYTTIMLPIAITFIIFHYIENQGDIWFKIGISLIIVSIITMLIGVLDSFNVLPEWLWFYDLA